MTRLGYADIQSLLPHRHPMLMVDAVLSLEPHRSIVAIKCVSGNEPCYARVGGDATPRETAYPPSLILESFSQAGAILWARSMPPAASNTVLMFGAARDCAFERDVQPGDTMEHRVLLERAMPDTLFLSGETWVAGTRVARFGSLLAVTRPADALTG